MTNRERIRIRAPSPWQMANVAFLVALFLMKNGVSGFIAVLAFETTRTAVPFRAYSWATTVYATTTNPRFSSSATPRDKSQEDDGRSKFNSFQISDDANRRSVTPMVSSSSSANGDTSRQPSSPPSSAVSGSAASRTAGRSKGGPDSVFPSLLSGRDASEAQPPPPPPGDWEEMHGNYLLRPPAAEYGAPRALIHFLGGALVGAAPHLSYRYLLEQLASKGYLIVATPYPLSFDHLQSCDAVLSRFERIAVPLARTYGALPVVGVGHSTGALLQLLITSLFPDTPRAANALISYNNKPVSEAVPLFEELVAPFFTYVAAHNATNQRRNGSQVISTVLELAKTMTRGDGELPSDELLSRAVRLLLIPPGLDQSKSDDEWPNLTVPPAIRETVAAFVRSTPAAALLSQAAGNTGTSHYFYDVLQALEQIPLLIEEVAAGARDFVPVPSQVQAAARRAYRARNTLVLQFEDDRFDESADIEELLNAAGQVIRMKRPMVQINVDRRNLPNAGHASPLLAPPSLEIATRAEDLLGPEVAREQLQYANAFRTVQELEQWLEASNL